MGRLAFVMSRASRCRGGIQLRATLAQGDETQRQTTASTAYSGSIQCDWFEHANHGACTYQLPKSGAEELTQHGDQQIP